ncbi:hypothetical protein JY97_03755 [Alkalispirochaeta odontotermitis]|nr:hypothetical protein JY97_03755 [Alkalispirochaeta odontotermitis]CAB1076840.1 hypothetical protein D1AOALGA4SA_4637 [Olavius algarvensis Delta 1 endosymbiont]
MSESDTKSMEINRSKAPWVFFVLVAIGVATFIFGLTSQHPERAWQAYLINFLLWSAIAQGAVLFSAVMHMTNARWSGPLSGLSESFAAFFPISYILFLVLFLGRAHIFPWLYEDLHGKEVWLNIPFLFTRDCIGLLILYILGFGYLFNALQLKIDPNQPRSKWRQSIVDAWQRNHSKPEEIKRRMTIWGGFYILAFALVLSLIGFDLVMSMDPHWISTLFGAYHFVKAFFIGLGALIILAAIIRIKQGEVSGLKDSHFHDIGKLFFGFCLLWADFFYVQLMVIYYGNIPEETHYVIVRTMLAPWNKLAWTVFIVCFVGPFFILLNQRIKTKPVLMLAICSVVIVGIWLEHLLLIGPALSHDAQSIPLSLSDGLISLGFLGLMAIAIGYYLKVFPETVPAKESS